MDQEVEQVLVHMEMALRHHRSTEQIDEPTLHKGWVMIAHEYARHGALNDAVMRLRWCPSDYFAVTLGRQMADDSDFREVAYSLARSLVDEGVADISQRYFFFGPVGRA